MEATPQEEVEEQKETIGTAEGARPRRLISRFDLPFLIAAVISGFVAASSDAWWTVRTPASDSILQASVSPFFVRIIGLGAPSSVPNADITGIVARVGIGLTAVALALQGVFPLSISRKTVLWLSLSVVAGVFLNFALLLHSTQLVLLQQYGVVPQLTGDGVIPGVVLGTNLVTYSSPTITSSLGLEFYLGLVGFILLGGSEFARSVLFPRLVLASPEFLTGLTGAFLSPPYEHTWLTSEDLGLNPLKQDPDRLTDDQLALSFEGLMKALQPGATVSIILPPWATRLGNRLAKVMSWTGLNLEDSQVIFRSPGRPENELVFRKPSPPEEVQPEPIEQAEAGETSEPPSPSEPVFRQGYHEWGDKGDLDDYLSTEDDLDNDLDEPGQSDIERPPVDERVEDPVWADELLPVEEMIVQSALTIIEGSGEPVPFDDMINQVYTNLVDKKVGFESLRDIEAVLSQHAGKELALLEEFDETNGEVVRKWWFGEAGIRTEAKSGLRKFLSRVGKRVRGAAESQGSEELEQNKEHDATQEDENSELDLAGLESDQDSSGQGESSSDDSGIDLAGLE